MRLTAAEFDHAHSVLKAHYEPIYQEGCAVIIMSTAHEAAKKHIDFPQTRSIITSKILQEMRLIANEEIKKYIAESNYSKHPMNREFFEGVEVMFESEGSEVKLVPSYNLLLLSQGKAPVSFFNHHRLVIENMWAEYKEKNPNA